MHQLGGKIMSCFNYVFKNKLKLSLKERERDDRILLTNLDYADADTREYMRLEKAKIIQKELIKSSNNFQLIRIFINHISIILEVQVQDPINR